MSIIWSQEAQMDAKDYWMYIAMRDIGAADRWIADLDAAAANAERFPHIGTEIPERRGYRQVIVHSHKLIYRIFDEGIEVMRVWHSAKLLHASDLGEEE
jgi:plasmid stabilization system protein ParE